VFGRASHARRQAAGAGAGTQTRSAKNQLPAAQRWAGVVQKHPVLATISSAAFILILAAPALVMKCPCPMSPRHRRDHGGGVPVLRAHPGHPVKQIGLGLAAAVLVDATVVRLVLVPAVMEPAAPGPVWCEAAAGSRSEQEGTACRAMLRIPRP